MRERSLKSALICAISLFLSLTGVSTGTWETLDYPGSSDTWMEGAGNGYICGYSWTEGFTYDGSTWRTYNHYLPGLYPPVVTCAWENKVAGWVQETSGDQTVHGFLYDGTDWTIISVPDATYTAINGYNGSLFVGQYNDSSESHGFTYDGSTWTTLDKPGAGYTRIRGISGNDIFGRADYSGFIYDGSSWITLDAPGAFSTEIRGISGQYIVGNYAQPANVMHGFLYDGTTWTTLDMPWPNGLIVGITGDTILGSYVDEYDHIHGAVYTIPEPATVLLLGLGGLLLRRTRH